VSSIIVVRREGGLVTATLNRPERVNVLGKEYYQELRSLLDVLETDRGVRALVFTGAGEKAFSAGADLRERLGMTEKEITGRMESARSLYLRLERLGCPTIACINGMAIGGGLELALACDLRVAAAGAVLGLVEVELGAIPGNGGTQRLARIVGLGKALEWTLLARRFTAEEALAAGLVHAVAPASELKAVVREWTSRISDMAPLALKQAKLAIRGGLDRGLEAGIGWEIECYRPLFASKDRTEGLKAFNEKRKPVYRGE